MTRPQVAAAAQDSSATTHRKQTEQGQAKQTSPNTAAAQSKLVAASRKNKYKAYCEQLYNGMPHSARMPSARVKTAALAAGCPRITHELGQVANVYAYKTLVMVNAMALEIANLDRATRVNEKHVLKAMLALEVPVDCLRESDTFAPLFDEELDASDRATSFADSPLDEDDDEHKQKHQASAREQYVQHIARTHLARIRGLRLGPLVYDQDDKDADKADKADKAEKAGKADEADEAKAEKRSRKRARADEGEHEQEETQRQGRAAHNAKQKQKRSRQTAEAKESRESAAEFDMSDISDDDSDEEQGEEETAAATNASARTKKAKRDRSKDGINTKSKKTKKDSKKDSKKHAKKDKKDKKKDKTTDKTTDKTKKKSKQHNQPEWAQLDALMTDE